MQIYLNKYIWFLDGTLTGTTTPDQSESENKEDERILHTTPKAGASLSDSV